jgi:hypothetical protein
MSGHSTDPFSDQVHKATAPTPGFRGATSGPSAPGVRDNHPTRQGRGGGRRGTQGCPSRIAHSPDKVLRWERKTGHIAANGRTARPSENLSSQPPRPAGLRVTSRYGPTRTTVESFDRSQCPGKPGAHDPKRVGTYNAYGTHWGCRCPDTREAWRLFNKRGREGRRKPEYTEAIGTVRRLRALAHLGYSAIRIGEDLDLCITHLRRVRGDNLSIIFASTHRKVVEYYNKNSSVPLPPNAGVNKTVQHAIKSGWAPPIAWDDDAIDDPEATPQHQAKDNGEVSANEEVDLSLVLTGRYKIPEEAATPAARRERRRLTIQVVGLLTENGCTTIEIMERLGLSERQVLRHKKVLREQREARLSDPRAINNTTAETTPSTGTPREAPAA